MSFVLKQKDDGSAEVVATEGASTDSEITVTFTTGVDAVIGRGATDTDITYLRLRNSQGEVAYIYPNATQDGVTVSGTKP